MTNHTQTIFDIPQIERAEETVFPSPVEVKYTWLQIQQQADKLEHYLYKMLKWSKLGFVNTEDIMQAQYWYMNMKENIKKNYNVFDNGGGI